MSFPGLISHALVNEAAVNWLKEDIPSFDVGGFVVGEKAEEAHIYFKDDGILAGVPFANAVFAYLECTVEWLCEEGVMICGKGSKVVVAKVKGKCCQVLQAERTVLNILTRASGIATLARQAKEFCDDKSWHGCVAGTRKTTPGFRLVEKYAMVVGGIAAHRYDLSQMVMLKDNHIWSAGSITKAVHKAKSVAGFSLKIEVECQDVNEALEACAAGADIVMLDNMSPEALHAAAGAVKKKFPHALVEASGGITMQNMKDYMSTHVDVISSSLFTQGHTTVDISMKIQKKQEAWEERTVKYGHSASQHFRLRVPTATTAADSTAASDASALLPIIVIIHGGFWKYKYNKDNSAIDSLSPFFLTQGFTTCEVEYRRVGAPEGTDIGGYPASIDDVKAALDCLHASISGGGGDIQGMNVRHLNAQRMVLIGHSAGGYLALCAAAIVDDHHLHSGIPPAYIAGCVALAPVTDLWKGAQRKLSDDGTAIQKFMHISDALPHSQHLYESASPIFPGIAPTLMVAGDKDEDVPADIVFAPKYGDLNSVDKLTCLTLADTDHYDMVNANSSGFKLVYSKMKNIGMI